MDCTFRRLLSRGAASASAAFSVSTAATPASVVVASVTSAATSAAAPVVAAAAAAVVPVVAVPAAAAAAGAARTGSSAAAASVRAGDSAVSLGSAVAAVAMPVCRDTGLLCSLFSRECPLLSSGCNNGGASAVPFSAASRSSVLHIRGEVFMSATPSQRLLLAHRLAAGFPQRPAAAAAHAATRQAAALQVAAVYLRRRLMCNSSSSVCWLKRTFSSCAEDSSAGSAAAGGSSSSSSGSHRRPGGESSWNSTHRSSSSGRRGSSRQQRREGSSSSGSSSSSFIRSILQQVKTDMEENEELQKAMKELKASQLTQKSVNVGQRVQDAATAAAAGAKKVFSSTQQLLNTAAQQAAAVQQQFQEKTQQASEKHPAFKEVQTAVGRVSDGLRTAVTKLEALSSSLFRDDDNDAQKKAVQWQQQMALRRHKQQQREKQRQQQQQMQQQETPDSSTNATTATGQQQSSQQQSSQQQQHTRDHASTAEEDDEEQPIETALVVSQRTTWDRFGSRLREMPLLQNFLNNPLVSQLFGETEIAASIREMKTLDPKFKLVDLHNLVERVVASHVVQAFLVGDEETLALHCGEGAFAALRASILERRLQRVRLDSEILQLNNVDLVGARRSLSPPLSAAAASAGGIRSSEEVPWFIYTFHCQQINCLRSEVNGKIVEGSADDIRRVLYSIAISRHPTPEAEGLLYPWMIQEIAIVGSEAVW